MIVERTLDKVTTWERMLECLEVSYDGFSEEYTKVYNVEWTMPNDSWQGISRAKG